MARGVRSNATLLPVFSPNLQPQSLSSYDPKTRRNTILIAEIVPTLALMESGAGHTIPADRYYSYLGGAVGGAQLPAWVIINSGTATFGNWDATDKRAYLKLDGSVISSSAGLLKFIYHAGPMGAATAFAPKNASTAACIIQFRARFPVNADYTVYGIGALNQIRDFGTATDHFIQVTRNSGNWELGTCDGSTISQSASSGGADGSFHDFKVRWADGEITLYVDDTLVVTKTTNLPTEPLGHAMCNNTDDIDIVDYLVSWELA